MASTFLDLMKGIISRLTILSPNDVDVTTGLTLYWTPVLDSCVPISTSWNVVLVIIAVSEIISSLEKFPPWAWGIVFVKFCSVAILLASAAVKLPKFWRSVSVYVFSTFSPTKSVCQEPQSTSLNPVWASIPNSSIAWSYSAVCSITFASSLFVSVQVSESGFNLISPW